jgi:phage-related protein (TIGR01555 family)
MSTETTMGERYLQHLRLREDSFFNMLTGLNGGENGVDATGKLAFDFVPNARLLDPMLEELYHHSWLAAKICDLVPSECLRQGFEVTTEGDGDKDAIARLTARLEGMSLVARLGEAWAWGRLYGGGALLLGIDDGREMHEPLDEANIRSFDFVTALDRRECWAFKWFDDPLSPTFGEPELFRLSRSTLAGTQTAEVHVSRVIRFHGVRTSRRKRMANGSWSMGVIQRVWDDMRQYNGAWVATAALLQEASVGVMAIADLEGKIAADKQDEFKMRMQAIALAKSVARMVLIDKDGESVTRTEATVLAGVPAVIDRFMSNLAAATDIPVPILFGEAPAGLNATADNTVRKFYDSMKTLQESELKQKLQRIIRLQFKAKNGPTQGAEPPNWTIKFRPLWQMTEKEQADLRLSVAQADQIYLTNGVVTAPEVATSRFRPEGWSPETVIELDDRDAATAAARVGEGDEPAGDTPAVDPSKIDAAALARWLPERRTGRALARDGRRRPDFRADAAGERGLAVVLPLDGARAAGLAVPGGVSWADLHLTLAYLGPADAIDVLDGFALRAAVRAWAARTAPFTVTLGAQGRFLAPQSTVDPVFLTPGPSGALEVAREDLLCTLAAVGLPASTLHAFIPHVTVAYVAKGDPAPAAPAAPIPVDFTSVGLWMGPVRETFALTGGTIA